MGKKICWALIVITVAINVVMLQWTIESYLGHEFENVFQYTMIAVITSIAAIIFFIQWRRFEYSEDN
ncbi:hypothetical protein [Alkalicoccus daliensis]|uniref:Uncharacterized protein n=1 Tax=Alkalicoccus daliensis TaxID=745820 RepID=A0A1H0EPF1_9BACI|nr:hypothetical protein [Alkalicoccus daliensis]SDN84284.1 hypothetical protein SAMN04488053_1046 [Alkalicoccus daliensis]